MELDKDDLKWGLEFIVGTWKIDYLVDFWSDNLEHIPAAKYKSPDGKKYNGVTFEFFEDHRLVMKDSATKKQVESTWEQTGSTQFHYSLNGFFELTEDSDADIVETLEVFEGDLAFSLGFITAGMKKTKAGKVTKEPGIGEIEPSATDLQMTDVVGTYKVAKMTNFHGDFKMATFDKIVADMKKEGAEGEELESQINEMKMMFGQQFEFTADHKLRVWVSTENVPENELKEMLESGEAIASKDGFICIEESEWKAVNGVYYVTDEDDESGWHKLEPNSKGEIEYRMMLIKKI